MAAIPVVTAPSVIDLDNASVLDQAIESAATSGHATVVIDLSRTIICLSAGVHVLAGISRSPPKVASCAW